MEANACCIRTVLFRGHYLADMSCVAENLLILALVNNLTVWI